MLIILVLGIIVIAYIAFHAVAYSSILHFFAITDPALKKILLIVLILLGLSFFEAVFLSHVYENVLTRKLYFISGIWIGFLINIVLLFALAWAAVIIFPSKDFLLHEKIIGIGVIFFAILFSMYGIWNAFTPVVTHIDVKIKNLPSGWTGKKIIQISDMHLGHVYNQKYLENVVQKINALKPDMILITGDLFDGTDGNIDVFADQLGKLEASKGIFYAIGNHETYLGVKEVENVIKKTKITLLRDQMQTVDGVQVIGIDYPGRMKTKDIGVTIKNMPDFNPEKPSILLWHTPTQTNKAKNAGISLQLSGHTHDGQLFPLGLITSFIFKGYNYGYKKEGDYSIYISSGLGGWGPPMRTEKRSEIVEITLR